VWTTASMADTFVTLAIAFAVAGKVSFLAQSLHLFSRAVVRCKLHLPCKGWVEVGALHPLFYISSQPHRLHVLLPSSSIASFSQSTQPMGCVFFALNSVFHDLQTTVPCDCLLQLLCSSLCLALLRLTMILVLVVLTCVLRSCSLLLF
jgi:hypothetical protein